MKMNRVLLAAALAVSLGVWAKAPVPTAPQVRVTPVKLSGEEEVQRGHYRLSAYEYVQDGRRFSYLLHIPANASKKKLPLVVHIPGNGEKGDLANQFRQQGLFERVTGADFQRKFPCCFLSISPPVEARTLTGGIPGKPTEYQRILHDLVFDVVRRTGRVDPKRIYLTGFSYGGSGVYSLALNYPGVFAATVAISSLPPLPEYFSPDSPGNWWHIYNELDYERTGMEVEPIRWFRDQVNAAGGDFRISSFPEQGHDAWTKTWMEDAIWKWMFTKKSGVSRRAVPGAAKPSVIADSVLYRAKCTATVRGRDAKSGPERVADGLAHTAYAPVRAFTPDDWWMIEFVEPVSGRFALFSGDRDGGGRLKRAYVEVSDNGTRWTRAATFSEKDGSCRFVRSGDVKYLRVRTDAASARFTLHSITVTGF